MLDRRVKRTQQLLANALIALTLEKSYEEINIREITERADIGYATFFRHYPDKDTLLHAVLATVFHELSKHLSIAFREDATGTGGALFHYVQEHSEIIRVLLKSGETSELVKQVLSLSEQKMQADKPLNQNPIVPFEIALYHNVASTISLIQWWLEHDMPYAPEQMGAIYQELIVRPTGMLH
ncbi:TetR/AcrR family transcriptional regulator [Tengunoibacter tsumagoiensis]|uniref:TetR family transcriptional regulator n=1 Tax=Tengunoibacter tsumagoiensis TaxID=2014871 RepID=A0A402A147_9CHLR|nr:TetR/AcrR family transcriptional regulator [Tengunoibacter tsumagoiensis]GCE12834.1 TetR family transcriptional regulator [Tengunoibacter tsumagoiensis]